MEPRKQSLTQRQSKAAADVTAKKKKPVQKMAKDDKKKKPSQMKTVKKEDKKKPAQHKAVQFRLLEPVQKKGDIPPFELTAQRKSGGMINGITATENENVKQLTNGQVDLHASGAKVQETSQNDPRLKNVGARSLAAGGQALIGDKRDRGHEIWHLAQQAQRRVQPTTTVNGQAVNDNPALEKEADVMGAKVMQNKPKEEKKKK